MEATTSGTIEELFDNLNDGLENIMEISATGNPQATRSRGGYTLDSTLISNSRVVTVRNLRDAGLLTPVFSNVIEGSGLGAHVVTLYEAEFNDRARSFVITEETYRAILNNIEPHDEALDSDGEDRVQLSMTPITDDRIGGSREAAIDSRGRTRKFRQDTRFPAHTRVP